MPITRKKKKSISVPEQIKFDTSVSMETEENDIIEDNEKPVAAEPIGTVLGATATASATLAHNDSEQENEEDMVTAEEMVTGCNKTLSRDACFLSSVQRNTPSDQMKRLNVML